MLKLVSPWRLKLFWIYTYICVEFRDPRTYWYSVNEAANKAGMYKETRKKKNLQKIKTVNVLR